MSERNAELNADSDATESAASKLFDIRLLIGGLFVVYGVMLTAYGLFTSDKERAKAAGININLWLGLGMLVFGLLMLLWRYLNPVKHERPDAASDGPTKTSPAQDGGRHAQH